MKIVTEKIQVPEGDAVAEFYSFQDTDKENLSKIYINWIKLNKQLTFFYGRKINIPELLSEGFYCLFSGSLRLKKIFGSNINSSWDCYNIKNKKRIQIKATSVKEDLTSFGPRSEWDLLIFCDFYVTGDFKGRFDIYEIPSKLVYNHKINRLETFKDQQIAGRRPRLSIKKEIIIPNNFKPLNQFNVFS